MKLYAESDGVLMVLFRKKKNNISSKHYFSTDSIFQKLRDIIFLAKLMLFFWSAIWVIADSKNTKKMSLECNIFHFLTVE